MTTAGRNKRLLFQVNRVTRFSAFTYFLNRYSVLLLECVNETCKCDYIESFPAYSFNVNYDKRHNIVQFEWNISAVHTLASSLLSYIELR